MPKKSTKTTQVPKEEPTIHPAIVNFSTGAVEMVASAKTLISKGKARAATPADAGLAGADIPAEAFELSAAIEAEITSSIKKLAADTTKST